MLCAYQFLLLLLAQPVLMVQFSIAQDIRFPDDNDGYDISDLHVSGSKPVTERKPLKSPSQCKENMLLYPDDGHKSAWVCDCVEGFVYYPFDDNCYKPFSRGPCPEHEYIYLKVNESVPSCIHNPCNKTGEVPYENRGCFTLNSRGGACDSDEALLVNVTTYQLQCVSQFIAPEIIIDAPQRSCPRGSRRNNQGQCKDVL
ncbi:hypothetical protein QAD02_005587 [Eretmocerus hayati]|uniref:Uncharacterized protein n=1 Tax=Eretmocerus hayati TaxID=131215 RepID=A0ACC2NXQ9_9HYME|nr:hypothetical protein QAD02_005587 [Eretmocerus hayati]